jgi:hypothetical protein
MLSNIPASEHSSIIDGTRAQSAKRLDIQDPVLADRFSELVSGAKNALKSGQTVLPSAAVPSDKAVPRSLKDDLISNVTSLENTVSTIWKMSDMNGDKHMYLEKTDDFGSVAQVLQEYNDHGVKYFLATNYAHKTGISTMEEIQIFTKGK